MQLYGFPTLVEKEWHRLLVSVQGVGPKHALAMLGLLGTDGVGRAIGLGDAAALRRAPGVGPKLAERVVLELRSKAPTVMAMGARGARPALAGALADDGSAMPAAAPAAPASTVRFQEPNEADAESDAVADTPRSSTGRGAVADGSRDPPAAAAEDVLVDDAAAPVAV